MIEEETRAQGAHAWGAYDEVAGNRHGKKNGDWILVALHGEQGRGRQLR